MRMTHDTQSSRVALLKNTQMKLSYNFKKFKKSRQMKMKLLILTLSKNSLLQNIISYSSPLFYRRVILLSFSAKVNSQFSR